MLLRRQRIALDAAIVLVTSTWLVVYSVHAEFTVPGPGGQAYWIGSYPTIEAWHPWHLATAITIALTGLTVACTLLLGRSRNRIRMAISTGLLVLLAVWASILLISHVYYKPIHGGPSYRHMPDGTLWYPWETARVGSMAIVAITVAVAMMLRSRPVATANRIQRTVVLGGLCLIALTCLFPYVGTMKFHDAPPREIATSSGGNMICGCGAITFDQYHTFLLSVDGRIRWRSMFARWTIIAVLISGAVVILRLRQRHRTSQQLSVVT